MLAGEPAILITDDDRDFRETLSEALTPRGFRTHLAADGVEALEIVSREQVHLLLLDMHMPRLDGIETVRRLRQQQLGTPCILLSGQLDAELAEQARAADVFHSLSKPVKFRQVIDTVHRALQAAYG